MNEYKPKGENEILSSQGMNIKKKYKPTYTHM